MFWSKKKTDFARHPDLAPRVRGIRVADDANTPARARPHPLGGARTPKRVLVARVSCDCRERERPPLTRHVSRRRKCRGKTAAEIPLDGVTPGANQDATPPFIDPNGPFASKMIIIMIIERRSRFKRKSGSDGGLAPASLGIRRSHPFLLLRGGPATRGCLQTNVNKFFLCVWTCNLCSIRDAHRGKDSAIRIVSGIKRF